MGTGRAHPGQFTLDLRKDPRWYSNVLRPRGLYRYECMGMPVPAKVVYKIDLSGISDPWVFLGMIARFRDEWGRASSKRACENLYQSARMAALARMKVLTWRGRARVSLRGLMMLAT